MRNAPRSQTWNLMLLYCTVSTLNPIAAQAGKGSKSPNRIFLFAKQIPDRQDNVQWLTRNSGDNIAHLQPIWRSGNSPKEKNQSTLSAKRVNQEAHRRGGSVEVKETYRGLWFSPHCRGQARGFVPLCRQTGRRTAEWKRDPLRQPESAQIIETGSTKQLPGPPCKPNHGELRSARPRLFVPL